MGTNSISNLRIGIPLIGVKQWLGGVTYIELLVKALSSLPDQERPKIFLVITNLESLDLHRHIFPLADGFILLGWHHPQAASILQHPFVYCRSYAELANHIDFYYPVNSDVVSDVCSGSWIPDFQHVHLPEFFPKEELARRDGWFQKIASHAKIVVFSSRDSENDFRSLYPKSSVVTRILHFHALPVNEWYENDPVQIQTKYNLPDNFLICCNQFWIHKNHGRLFEAIAKVFQTGMDIHLVCTGSIAEWRVKDYYSNLIEMIERLNIKDRIHILGTIPRNDQIQLIRRSLAVIQPSLFEGWSTVVEDSRVLGKTMILSDLAVHYEQAPDHAVFFSRNNPDDLAGKISDLLPTLGPGPDASREQKARTKARELVLNYAREFCDIALEAQRLCGKIIPEADSARDSTAHILSSDKIDQAKPLVETVKGKGISSPAITVATSIAPKNIENQQAAVASWLKLGFRVVSLNNKEEIIPLKEHFPEVTFVEASRNALKITGTPYVFFDDVLKVLNDSKSQICGIVNSDIHLRADDKFHEFVYAEAKDKLLYGTRIDVDSIDTLNGQEYPWGFDYFFFDKKFLSIYPISTFCIGAPWWDLWAVFIPTIKNVPIDKFANPIGYHKNHPKNWSFQVWTIYCQEFISHLEKKDIKPYLTPGFLERFHYFMKLRQFQPFSAYVVTFIDQKSEKITIDTAHMEPHHMAEVDVSIIVATKNRAQLLDEMLTSLKKAAEGVRYEIIVIEGNSTDNTLDVLKKHGITQIYDEKEHLGEGKHSWPRLYNFGFSKASGTWAMYASDDIIFQEGCISKALEILNKQDSNVAGGIFFYKNVHIALTGKTAWNDFGIDYMYGQKLLMNYGLVRLEAFREVKGLDEQYHFYCADSDLCLKLYEQCREFIPLPGCCVVHNNVFDVQKEMNMRVANRDIDRLLAQWRHFVSTALPNPRRLMWKDFEVLPLERLKINFRDVQALISLAEIEIGRLNKKKAMNYLIAATALEPENAEAKALMEKLP